MFLAMNVDQPFSNGIRYPFDPGRCIFSRVCTVIPLGDLVDRFRFLTRELAGLRLANAT